MNAKNSSPENSVQEITRHPLCDSTDLAFELALGYFDLDGILLRYGIDRDTLDQIKADRSFQILAMDQARKVDERGDAFRLRARQHMEKALRQIYDIIRDGGTTPNTKIKATELLGRYAGYDGDEQAAAGVTLEIKTNLAIGHAGASQGVYTIEARQSEPGGGGEDLV